MVEAVEFAPRPRILVVDDEPDIVQGLATFLQGAVGAEVVTAGSGPEGIAALKAAPADLVISDYKMPGMDGFQFLNEAKRLRPAAARIMMTAYADLDLALQALNQARILHFFTKPFDPDQVAEVVRAIVHAQAAERQLGEALKRSVEQMKHQRRDR
jgi:thioredoxin reductase (NADPH)